MYELHREAGARVAERWKLGPWMGLVIRHHHDPAAARYHPREVPVVALADALAYWALAPDTREGDFVAHDAFVQTLKLHEGALRSLLVRRHRILDEIAAYA